MRVFWRRSRRRTKGRGNAGERKRRGTESAARQSAFLRDRIGFAVFSAGSPLGLRAPDCAKEPLALWTLFIWVVMWGRFTRRRGSRRSEDLTGLRSFCASHAFLSKCPVFDHACCLPPVRQTGRLAICSVPVPPWVGIAGSAFSDVAWLSGFVGSLRACAFLYGDPDGERKGRGNAENGGNGERSRRRGRVRFCVTALALLCFPRGVRWGCAPQTAPKSHWLSGLSSFGSRRGGVSHGEGDSGAAKT